MHFKKFLMGLMVLGVFEVHAADNADVGKKILERMTGRKVPADSTSYKVISDLVKAGKLKQAAEYAQTQPGFLNNTVKQMGLMMSTREESRRTVLNDFTATLIGVIRDDLDARLLLTGDFLYRGDPAKIPAGITVDSDVLEHIVKSNEHYKDLNRADIDLGAILIRVDGQPILKREGDTDIAVNNPDAAGVLTSRAFLEAHAIAGTNRRLVEFTFREFMCLPIEKWADASVSDERIGRDIDRFPGGDHQKFQTSCKSCHTGMDGFRGAFAQFDFNDGRVRQGLVNGPDGNGFSKAVSNKYARNRDVFPYGFTTTDNSWVNMARGPANTSLLGWRGNNVANGNGVKSLGSLIANSSRFSSCLASRVFESVCRKPATFENAQTYLNSMGTQFEGQNYNLKKLFVDVLLSKECGL